MRPTYIHPTIFCNFDNRLTTRSNWTDSLERGSGLGLFLIGSSPFKLLCYAYVNSFSRFLSTISVHLSAFFFFFSHTNPPPLHLYTSFPTLSIPIGFLPPPCISSNSVHLFFFFFPADQSSFHRSRFDMGNSPIPYVKTILFSSAMLTSQVINNVFYLPRLTCSRKLRSDHYGFAYADDYGESRIYLRR